MFINNVYCDYDGNYTWCSTDKYGNVVQHATDEAHGVPMSCSLGERLTYFEDYKRWLEDQLRMTKLAIMTMEIN